MVRGRWSVVLGFAGLSPTYAGYRRAWRVGDHLCWASFLSPTYALPMYVAPVVARQGAPDPAAGCPFSAVNAACRASRPRPDRRPLVGLRYEAQHPQQVPRIDLPQNQHPPPPYRAMAHHEPTTGAGTSPRDRLNPRTRPARQHWRARHSCTVASAAMISRAPPPPPADRASPPRRRGCRRWLPRGCRRRSRRLRRPGRVRAD